MHRRRNALAASALLLSLAFTVVGCSSDTNSASPATTSPLVDPTATTAPLTDLNATTTTTIGPAQVYLRAAPLGEIVVDADGMTLYAKVAGPVDGCTGACLDAWPPLRATSVTVGAGLDPTFAVVTDGVVTYRGQPLYRFVGDAVPGDTTGQGFNGTYFVVLANGTIVRPLETTTTTAKP